MGKRIAEHALPLIGTALVVVVAVGFLLFHFGVPSGKPKVAHSPPAQAVRRVPSPAATPPPPPPPTPSATPAPAVPPVRLVVPAAQINAPVETVGLTGQGAIGVPTQPADAAWYNGSVAPGQPGNAILDGHLDWWTGPAVFLHLAQLKAGDQIELVRADGSQVTFAVTGQQVFGANDSVPASMLATTGPATISLITCSGAWDAGQSEYLQRLVVNGTLS